MTALNTIPAEENDTLLNKPKASAQEFRRSIRGTDDDIPIYVEDTHGGATPIDHYAVYNYDRWSLADKGLYKLWRDDGSAGGYYTVALKDGYPYPYLEFTCRANDSWDDLSDEC